MTFPLAGLLFFLGQASSAQAGINLQLWHTSLNPHFAITEDSSVSVLDLEEKQKPVFLAQFTQVEDPLVQFDARGENRESVVSRARLFELGIGWVPWKKTLLALQVPGALIERPGLGTS